MLGPPWPIMVGFVVGLVALTVLNFVPFMGIAVSLMAVLFGLETLLLAPHSRDGALAAGSPTARAVESNRRRGRSVTRGRSRANNAYSQSGADLDPHPLAPSPWPGRGVWASGSTQRICSPEVPAL
jgi:hypothetical protein